VVVSCWLCMSCCHTQSTLSEEVVLHFYIQREAAQLGCSYGLWRGVLLSLHSGLSAHRSCGLRALLLADAVVVEWLCASS
jgi:hypothetical protein